MTKDERQRLRKTYLKRPIKKDLQKRPSEQRPLQKISGMLAAGNAASARGAISTPRDPYVGSRMKSLFSPILFQLLLQKDLLQKTFQEDLQERPFTKTYL